MVRHRNRPPPLLNKGRCDSEDYVLPPLHSLGLFNENCQHCGAIKFHNESFKCCHNGKVNLPNRLDFPEELRELFQGNSAIAKQFRRHIRIYNNAFSFASMHANIRPPPGNGPPCFRVCG